MIYSQERKKRVKIPWPLRKKRGAYAYRGRKVLHIDLTNEQSRLIQLSEEESKQFLGGHLLALHLYERFVEYDKLDGQYFEAHNPLILAPALAADIDPGRFSSLSLVTKDPRQNALRTQSVETPFAAALLNCEYAALILTGRCRKLTGITLDHGQVEFYDAEAFYEATTSETKRRSKKEHLICIGPAAEHHGVHSSISINAQNVPSSTAFALVLAYKNVKLIGLKPHASGREGYNTEELGRLTKRYERRCCSSPLSKRVAKNGELCLLEKANTHGWAALGGHRLRYDLRLVHLYERYSKEADTYSLLEALALGANLEIFEPKRVAQLARRCSDNGLDPIAIGALFSWARFARKEGKLGFLPELQSRLIANFIKVLDAISYEKGSGHQLAKSFDELSKEFGGSEGMCTIGNEALPPFDYRGLPTQALLLSVGDHHLVLGELIRGRYYRRGFERVNAKWALFIQELSGAEESIGINPYENLSFFGWFYPLFKGRTSRFKKCAHIATLSEGRMFTTKELMAAGREAFLLQRSINQRLGFEEPVFAEQQLSDGRSNYKRMEVVPLVRLKAAYHDLLRRWQKS